MNENILDFYKNKTKDEQEKKSTPYKKIMNSKMERAKEISDKIVLNEKQILSSWQKIIKDFENNNDKEQFVKDMKLFSELYVSEMDIHYFLYDYIKIQYLIDNIKDKKKVKECINTLNYAIEYNYIFSNESQRSQLEYNFYRGNNLVLEELRDLKKIVYLDDFREIFSEDFNINADKLNNILEKYIKINNETILEKNIKELYEAL